MTEEMSTIPPRVNALEREVHTLTHRLAVVEESHRDTPHRITVLELAVERLPKIEERLEEQSAMIYNLSGQFKTGVSRILYTVGGMGSAFAAWQIGPQILKFLGGA